MHKLVHADIQTFYRYT